ncbi:hypothetical protein FS749_004234 [Ceratobasidium sp. UAMH 11750]|nr:hypothetical protein FS749_004234 [Ceratobasidium sp. UAMH 11750]
MYQTPNGAFTYTIQTLYDLSTGTPTSNANYNGSDLTNCKVDKMTISTSYTTYEAVFQATINCTLKGDIELTATTSSVVRISDFEWNNRVTPVASNISRLIDGFNGDAFNDLVYNDRNDSLRGDGGKPLTAMYQTFRMDAGTNITWMYGSVTAAGWISNSSAQEGFRQYVGASSVESCENYIRIFTASVLSDLGVVSEQNPLTSADAFRSAIRPLNWTDLPLSRRAATQSRYVGTSGLWPGREGGGPGPGPDRSKPFANVLLGGNMSEYNLPFDFVRPTNFNAYYLCHYFSWKSPSSLAIDVFVATASLFMVYWGTLNLLLTFFAKRESEKANRCVCTNCDTDCLAGKWES